MRSNRQSSIPTESQGPSAAAERVRRSPRLSLAGIAVLGVAIALALALVWSGELTDWFSARSPAEDQALQALVALRQMTQSGTTYQEYATRVSETYAQVSRALSDRNGSEARQPLQMAMNYYAAAALAWEASQGSREAGWLGLAERFPRDAEFSLCPAIRFVFEQADKQRRSEETFAIEALNIAPIWICAADQVFRAERLLRPMKN